MTLKLPVHSSISTDNRTNEIKFEMCMHLCHPEYKMFKEIYICATICLIVLFCYLQSPVSLKANSNSQSSKKFYRNEAVCLLWTICICLCGTGKVHGNCTMLSSLTDIFYCIRAHYIQSCFQDLLHLPS